MVKRDMDRKAKIFWGDNIRQIGIGKNHTCALKLNGLLNCWSSSSNWSQMRSINTIPKSFKKDIKYMVVNKEYICVIK